MKSTNKHRQALARQIRAEIIPVSVNPIESAYWDRVAKRLDRGQPAMRTTKFTRDLLQKVGAGGTA